MSCFNLDVRRLIFFLIFKQKYFKLYQAFFIKASYKIIPSFKAFMQMICNSGFFVKKLQLFLEQLDDVLQGNETSIRCPFSLLYYAR